VKLALWIVARFVPGEWRESVAGDLHEEQRRRIHTGLPAGAGWAACAALITTFKIVRETRKGVHAMSDHRGFQFESWLTDIRLAIRSLASAPSFTLIALLVLTLGIGATTAIFSVVDAVILRRLPFDQSDRLVAIGEKSATRAFPPGYVGSTTAPTFYDWRDRQQSFQSFAASVTSGNFVTRDDGRPERLAAMRVTAAFFDVLRVHPVLGQIFTDANERAGSDHVAVISDAMWRRRFNADPAVIGQSLNFDAGQWTIIGVLPPDFSYPVASATPTELFVPFVPTGANDTTRTAGRNYYLRVIGRLKDHVSVPQAAAEMAGITQQLAAEYPKWYKDQASAVELLHESTVGRARSWMLMMLGAVGCVLLIACVNVANLMLARATTRSREIGIRAALGASRWQIARGLLVESLVLSIAGTLIGLLVASWGVGVLRNALPSTLPRVAAIGIDVRVLLVAAAAAVVTGVLFGLAPALQFSRPDLSRAVGEAGRSGMAGRDKQRLRSSLVIAEVALAVVLLVGAGLFVSSFVRLVTVPLGLDYKNVLMAGLNPRLDGPDPDIWKKAADRTPSLVAEVVEKVRAIPGVTSVAALQGGLPLTGSWSRNAITVPGHPVFDSENDQVDIKKVTPEYASVVSVQLRRGRYLNADDTVGAPKVMVINEESAHRFFDGKDPIGVTVNLEDADRTIVGIVSDVRLGGPESPIRPEAYLPFAQTDNIGASLMVKTSVDPALVAPALRQAIQDALPDVPLTDPVTMESSLAKMLSQRKFNMLLIGLFGVLAVTIAAAGIYGVMAYIVAQQRREIGLRMALGALPRGVLRMVLGRATTYIAIGAAIGFGGAWWLSTTVSAFLFSVQPHDPAVYLTVGALLLGSGLLAAFVPALRAARVDPMVALRE
jgi:predicted permease